MCPCFSSWGSIELPTLCKWEIMNLACSKKEKRNFIVLSMGATLEASWHERMINLLMSFVDIDIHHPQNYIFIPLFQLKQKALAHEWSLLPSAKGQSLLLCWVSKPISLYLKQAFELLWFNLLCVLIYSSIIFYFSLCSIMLLSEWIYHWKFNNCKETVMIEHAFSAI